LRESLGVLTHLNLFVGGDTAIMHAAAALGVPTVALFGPTNAHKWGNYGECRRVIQSTDGTMGSIDVAAVMDAVRDLRR
jgi:ADP-heptose:LPS heptosyltransferase